MAVYTVQEAAAGFLLLELLRCSEEHCLEEYDEMIERGFDLEFGPCTILSFEEFKSQKGNDCGWLEFLDGRSDVYRVLVFAESLDMARGFKKGATESLLFHVQPGRSGGFNVTLKGKGDF